MAFRVAGVLVVDTDDYYLYVTNLPDEFTPKQVAALYGLWWEVELLFRELKSLLGYRSSRRAIQRSSNYWA